VQPDHGIQNGQIFIGGLRSLRRAGDFGYSAKFGGLLMAGLALKLAPKERVLINGVVIENGPRRAQLLIKTDNASVLRLRDALDEQDVIGPASKAYFTAQRCVAGEISADEAEDVLMPALPELEKIDPDATAMAKRNLSEGNLYRVMRALRPMLEVERETV